MTSNTMLGTHGFLAKLFDAFEQLAISVDLIATSEVSVTVTVDEKHDIDKLKARLGEMCEVDLVDGQSIIAVVGKNVMADARTATVLEALDGIPLKMISLGRSGLNLSIVVDDANADAAVQAIHHALFEAPVAV
jgi:aspartate kinase